MTWTDVSDVAATVVGCGILWGSTYLIIVWWGRYLERKGEQ